MPTGTKVDQVYRALRKQGRSVPTASLQQSPCEHGVPYLEHCEACKEKYGGGRWYLRAPEAEKPTHTSALVRLGRVVREALLSWLGALSQKNLQRTS